jgi:hypothetical protein
MIVGAFPEWKRAFDFLTCRPFPQGNNAERFGWFDT